MWTGFPTMHVNLLLLFFDWGRYIKPSILFSGDTFILEFPATFRNPLIWVQSSFGNFLLIAPSNSGKSAGVSKLFHRSSYKKDL
jgi:hypothetical protein